MTYRLAPYEERSTVSHSHYFACLNDAWANLPDEVAWQYPTAEKLRKTALIRTGYTDERSTVCASNAEALRIAAFIRPMDDYAIVTVKEAVVTIYTAKSQSYRAMGKQEFQKSKDAVIEWISNLIGVATDDLERNAGRAA